MNHLTLYGLIKESIKKLVRPPILRFAFNWLRRYQPGSNPSIHMLKALRFGWGNELYSADLDYLSEVIKRGSQVEGTVIECGSGLTSCILGIVANNEKASVITLENNQNWYSLVQKQFKTYSIEGVNLQLTPLKDYGQFSGYQIPETEIPLAIHLVVCDGPPYTTPGGRYGFFPTLGERLIKGGIILLDDAGRTQEAEIIDQWKKESNLTVELCKRGSRAFAIITKIK